MGVVFGDIGTSPIYTLQTVFNAADPHPIPVSTTNVYGVVSPNRLPAVGVAWHRDIRPNCGDLADSEPTDGALHRRAPGPAGVRPGFQADEPRILAIIAVLGLCPFELAGREYVMLRRLGGHAANRRLKQLTPSGLEDPVLAGRAVCCVNGWISRFVIPADGLFMGQGYVAVVLAL